MDVRKLQYLIEVIERGSIGKAAAALRVSQPALTKALRILEGDVGAQLVERSRMGVRPTEFGRSLYSHAKAIVAEVDRARAELAQLKGEEIHTVRIASLPSLSVIVARGVAQAMKADADRVERAVEMQNYQLLPGLRRGEFDFVIGLGSATEAEPGIRQRVIGHDRLQFVVRAGHPALKLKKLTLAHLLEYPWVFPIVGTNQYFAAIREIFHGEGLRGPEPRIETGSMQFVKTVVHQSNSIAILAQHVFELEVFHGQMIALPFESTLLERTLVLSHRVGAPLSRAARGVLAEIERVLQSWERSRPGKRSIDPGSVSEAPKGIQFMQSKGRH
jgi:DNA-binding transcriptional LysR family regulator